MSKPTNKWELLGREEYKDIDDKFFIEEWVHAESKSGIAFYSSRNPEGRKVFITEGYGVGTVNPKDFTELKDDAPIQRYVCISEERGRVSLDIVKQNIIKMWKKESDKRK